MAEPNEVGIVVCVLGIAAGLAAGVATGRVAARLVEEDIARVAVHGEDAAHASGSLLEEDSDASFKVDGVTRYKVPVTRSQPSLGPSDALVTIIEWCDLFGEPCRRSDELLTQALARHPLDVRRVFRHLPKAELEDARAHELARVAYEQGKFWSLRARLLQHDSALSLAELETQARAVGVGWDAAELALERYEYTGYLAADRSLARTLSIHEGPVLFVNGRRLDAPITDAKLSTLIDEELERAASRIERGAPREHIYADIIRSGIWHTRAEPHGALTSL